ncbi:MAG: sterol desaturase family protein [Myxococcota bacterium]
MPDAIPTPLDILLDPISLIVIALYGGLMLWETLAPARPLPRVAGWHLKGITAFAGYFFLSSYLPLFTDGFLAEHRLVDLSGLPLAAQIGLALLVYELGAYAYHRAMHERRGLWLASHQMHHSAERLDVAGAFWFSPVDMVGWTLVGSLTLVGAVGIGPEAATAVLLALTFLGIFQHANVRTPRWLGVIVQRPESHALHHARGVHAKNFADLPLVDMLFGTFENPEGFAPDQGFYEGASSRVLEMLAFQDVSEPRPDAELQRPSWA